MDDPNDTESGFEMSHQHQTAAESFLDNDSIFGIAVGVGWRIYGFADGLCAVLGIQAGGRVFPVSAALLCAKPHRGKLFPDDSANVRYVGTV